MSYLEGLLGEGERIIYATRQHWFILFARVFGEFFLLLLVIVVAGVATNLLQRPDLNQYLMLGALAIGALILFSVLRDYLRWRYDQYIVTDRRVLQLKGVLSKRVLDSSLEKINDVQLSQTLFGRMFGYGTVEILTASEEAINHMPYIANPIDFKRAMQDARARYEGYLRNNTYAQAQPRTDVHADLEHLAALRDRGILSDAEFEAKKRDLLSRI